MRLKQVRDADNIASEIVCKTRNGNLAIPKESVNDTPIVLCAFAYHDTEQWNKQTNLCPFNKKAQTSARESISIKS